MHGWKDGWAIGLWSATNWGGAELRLNIGAQCSDFNFRLRMSRWGGLAELGQIGGAAGDSRSQRQGFSLLSTERRAGVRRQPAPECRAASVCRAPGRVGPPRRTQGKVRVVGFVMPREAVLHKDHPLALDPSSDFSRVDVIQGSSVERKLQLTIPLRPTDTEATLTLRPREGWAERLSSKVKRVPLAGGRLSRMVKWATGIKDCDRPMSSSALRVVHPSGNRRHFGSGPLSPPHRLWCSLCLSRTSPF